MRGAFGLWLRAKLEKAEIFINNWVSKHFVGCSELKTFYLKKCSFVSDSGLMSFSKSVESLESLQLDECHMISKQGIINSLANCCKKLKALGLSKCIGIKDWISTSISLPYPPITNHLPLYITIVSLSEIGRNCTAVTDLDVRAAKQNSLLLLSLAGCSLVSDKSLPFLVSLGNTLVGLNVQNFRGISSSSISLLFDKLWR
ncbi:F-box/LRR-repeat protein 20, partial [Striga asiatica]